MRRKKIVLADDGDTKVRITIEINSPRLSRWETSCVAESLASRAMVNISEQRFLGSNLSQIKVK